MQPEKTLKPLKIAGSGENVESVETVEKDMENGMENRQKISKTRKNQRVGMMNEFLKK